MENIFATIKENLRIDGEDERYADFYGTLDEYIEDISQIEYDSRETIIKNFETYFGKSVDEACFPIITFSMAGSDSGHLFDSEDSRGDILWEARNFFQDNRYLHTWFFEGYTVFEQEEKIRFEKDSGKVLGYILKEDADNPEDDLDKGAEPIEDGWEDGVGNTISMDGWMAEHEE